MVFNVSDAPGSSGSDLTIADRDLRLPRSVIVLPRVLRVTPVQHYLSAVTVVKDESAYLEEWIEFHHMVGCSHFYVYDNDSSDRTAEILAPYIRRGLVTQIPWPDFMPWSALIQKCYLQIPAYAHAICAFGGQSRWMMFIDVDEFVFPVREVSLPDILADYEDLPSLALPWHMFGHSGHETKPSGLVIENYTMRAAIPPISVSLTKYKSVVDPTRVRIPGVHRFVVDEGALVYTQQREAIKEPNWKYVLPVAEDRIALNHYYGRAKDEFETKIAKAKVGQQSRAGKLRMRIELIEANTVEDLRIQRFVQPLKSRQDW